jgi:cytochrome c556
MHRKLITSITALSLVLGLSIQATAEPTAEDALKYRRSIMTALKGHAGALSMQSRGLAGDPAHVARHAEAIADLIAELHTVFQEGSNIDDSEALPVIWEDPKAFAEALAKAEDAAPALAEAAEGGDLKAIGGAFANVGKACKNCHENFRVDDD